MAITTLAGLIAGLRPLTPRHVFQQNQLQGNSGVPVSSWNRNMYGAGVNDTTLNGVTLSSSSAQVTAQAVRFDDPAAGQNTYLARFSAGLGAQQNSSTAMWLLCDRLWHNGGYTITSTSAQNSTTPTWPARDQAGATNGDGVLLALECSATVGNVSLTVTVSYTNSAGTSGRSGTNIAPTFNGITGSSWLISLQAGDVGVRSVQSLTLSASWLSGTINLVAFRPIAMIPVYNWRTMTRRDALQLGMPRLYDGTVPYLYWWPAGQTAVPGGDGLLGEIQYAQG